MQRWPAEDGLSPRNFAFVNHSETRAFRIDALRAGIFLTLACAFSLIERDQLKRATTAGRALARSHREFKCRLTHSLKRSFAVRVLLTPTGASARPRPPSARPRTLLRTMICSVSSRRRRASRHSTRPRSCRCRCGRSTRLLHTCVSSRRQFEKRYQPLGITTG